MKYLPSLTVATLACAGLLACSSSSDGADDPAASETALRIGTIQGAEPRSPLEGQRVEVQGVVTGNFVSGLDGFFMQDAAGEDDGDPATSDGIFVHWPRGGLPKVRRGDRVRVAGGVIERGEGAHSQTVIEATQVAPLGRGAAAAVILSQPPAASADWERFEGMWLRISAPLTVSGNDGLLRYGELFASFGGRQYQPTERHPPGAQARVAQEDNERRRLVLDDNRRGEYPDNLWFLPDGLSNAQPLRNGSVLRDVEGVLEQRFGWRLQLTAKLGNIEQTERPAPPEMPSGLRITSHNLLNYANGDGRGGGFPTERGPSSLEEMQRQRDKLVASMVALQPDIAALMEIENDGFDTRSSIARLVQALNERVGADSYRVIDVGSGPGSDVIRVGMIYRAAAVTPRGAPVVLERGAFSQRNRVPLAQAFTRAGGEGPAFTVVAVHFKSKGSCQQAESAGDRDAADGQGCWNATRRVAASELSDWLGRDPTGSGSPHAVLVGDFNSHAQEDPLRLLRDAGWRDAFEVSGTKKPYSFVWMGLSGRLDHAFVSASLAPFVRAAREWHSNADESEAFDYNRENREASWYEPGPFRAADHDPLILVLNFATR